jgi:hypothetical protein
MATFRHFIAVMAGPLPRHRHSRHLVEAVVGVAGPIGASGGIGLGHHRQVTHGIGSLFHPLAGGVGDLSGIALVESGGDAAVGQSDGNAAAGAVVGVGGPEQRAAGSAGAERSRLFPLGTGILPQQVIDSTYLLACQRCSKKVDLHWVHGTVNSLLVFSRIHSINISVSEYNPRAFCNFDLFDGDRFVTDH